MTCEGGVPEIPAVVNSDNVTDELIEALIRMPKELTAKRIRSPKKRPGCTELAYDLKAVGGIHTFCMRIVRNKISYMKYSIILNYVNEESENVILFRCNDAHSDIAHTDPLHSVPHAHLITAAEWRNCSRNNPRRSKLEVDYITAQEALDFFRNYCNIIGDVRFFQIDSIEEDDISPENENQITIEDIKGKENDYNN